MNNTLSSDVEIKGTLRFTQNLILEGRVEGEIITEGGLTVGESGYVKGNVNASRVVVFGRVDGDMVAKERCEVKSSADILGDITAGSFSIDEGASFQGRSKVGRAQLAQR